MAIISSFTKISVKHNVGMTGEITLRGHVTEIGSLKEKLIAAKRGLLDTVLIPDENQKDLVDVPDEKKKRFEYKYYQKCQRGIGRGPLAAHPEDMKDQQKDVSEFHGQVIRVSSACSMK
ncbi:MAG: hypothetical protein Ct9H300mP28_36080 [Pseudomonadota bacterium]|nr:MAG: hypothetical protein Ct9H300mP28_36080 [Pseudomonadota bacterium]